MTTIQEMGKKAKIASRTLLTAGEKKNDALKAIAKALFPLRKVKNCLFPSICVTALLFVSEREVPTGISPLLTVQDV